MKLSEYKINSEKIHGTYKFAIISDLHGCDPSRAIELLRRSSPDFILAPGDIFEIVDASSARKQKKSEKGFLLLGEAAKIAPTFYSTGNHEIGGTRSWAHGFKFSKKDAAKWSEKNRLKLQETQDVFRAYHQSERRQHICSHK